jgi:hypothetical protein
MKQCLTVDSCERPDFQTLLKMFEANEEVARQLPPSYIQRSRANSLDGAEADLRSEHSVESIKLKLFNGRIRSSYLAKNQDDNLEDTEDDYEPDHLWKRGVDEVFYLWKLAGGDFLQTLKQNGRLTNRLMPIEKMPLYITVDEGREYGKPCDEETLFDETIVALSLVNLRNRLNLLKTDTFYPIIEDLNSFNNEEATITRKNSSHNRLNNLCAADMVEATQKQPINIRETI